MYLGKTLFAQAMDFLPWKTFHRIVNRYGGDYRTRSLSCAEQFRVISVYVLVAIIKKKLRLDVSLHTLLQSLTLFEKLPLKQAVAGVEPIPNSPTFNSQLNLFEF